MAHDLTILTGKTYDFIRSNTECELLSVNKDVCVWVKGKTPSEVGTLLSAYTIEDDYYAIEHRNGCNLYAQVDLLNDVVDAINIAGDIVDLQTG